MEYCNPYTGNSGDNMESPRNGENGSSWLGTIDPNLRPSAINHKPFLGYQEREQQPLERYITEPQRPLFTANLYNQSREFSRALPRAYPPVSAQPHVIQFRTISPSPSQELSSGSSSAMSPGENDWSNDRYSPQLQDSYSIPSGPSNMNQGLQGLWLDRSQGPHPGQYPGNSCVNLSQVQSFVDTQDAAVDSQEGYLDLDSSGNYPADVEVRGFKSESFHPSYRHSSDEGIGASIGDEPSPRNGGASNVDDTQSLSDADADGDVDFEQDIDNNEELDDAEYTPKAPRTRKRRASKAASLPTMKRGRVSKSTSKSKAPFTCKSCDLSFKDSTALQKHAASAHTRAFVCTFDFAGCQATFASKNEWKRHVSSQHINLHAWVCEEGNCGSTRSTSGKKEGTGLIKGQEFNRKDLFTQHLRRMHAPFLVKRTNKKNAEWEDKLKELQKTCMVVRRLPPARLACPVSGCGTIFEGAVCWDDRMEHVGKHLEKVASGVEGGAVHQGDDQLLLMWALREGIVEQKLNGTFRLLNYFKDKAEDEDADGEDE